MASEAVSGESSAEFLALVCFNSKQDRFSASEGYDIRNFKRK